MEYLLIPQQSLKLGSLKIIQFPSDADDGTVNAGGRVTEPYTIIASRKLVEDLESHGIPADQLRVGERLEGPRLTLAFPFQDVQDEDDETSIPDQGFLRISGLETIAGLVTGDGFNVKIRLDIEHVVCKQLINRRDSSLNMRFRRNEDTTVHKYHTHTSKYIFPVTQNGPHNSALNVKKTTSAKLFETIWWDNDNDWTLLVSLSLLCSRIFGRDPDIPYEIADGQEMLSDDTLKDLTVVTENGSEIRALRCKLAAHSPVFKAMFHSDMKEAQTGVLELEGISEQSVRAFLEYLYVWKRTSAEENPDICVELLEAGHMYDIPHLENCMKHILLKKLDQWYTPDSVLRLAIFTKDIQHEELQKVAIKVLNAMQNEVETLPAFRKLCEKHEKSEKELFEYLTTI